MASTYSIPLPSNAGEHLRSCSECEHIKQEHVEAGVAFDVAHRSLQARGGVSDLDEFLRLHQAVLIQRQRLESARIALDRHFQKDWDREGAQAPVLMQWPRPS